LKKNLILAAIVFTLISLAATPIIAFPQQQSTETQTVTSLQQTNIGPLGDIEVPNDSYVWIGEGGGFFIEDGYKNNFGFYATNPSNTSEVNYMDRVEGYHFHSYIVDQFWIDVVSDVYYIHISGWGKVDKDEGYMFHVLAVDKGKPKEGGDEFHIWIYYPNNTLFDYSFGTLEGGNIHAYSI